MMLGSILLFCFAFQSFMIKLDYLFDNVPAIFTVIAISSFIIICL